MSWSILLVSNKLSYINLVLLLSFNSLSMCNPVSVVNTEVEWSMYKQQLPKM